jgi:hypothetical protein
MNESKEPATQGQTGRGQNQQVVKLETTEVLTSPLANQGSIDQNAGPDKFWLTVFETSGPKVVAKSRAELQHMVNAGETEIQVTHESGPPDWKLPAEFGIVPSLVRDVPTSGNPAIKVVDHHLIEAHRASPAFLAAVAGVPPLAQVPPQVPPPTPQAPSPLPPYPKPPQSASNSPAPPPTTTCVLSPVTSPSSITEESPITLKSLTGEDVPKLRDVLMAASDLITLSIAERVRILGEFLREGDFGYIYAPRGHGKTWLMMLIAHAISLGIALGGWLKGESMRRVVYFDAEMNLADVQARAKLIGMNSPNLFWLQSDLIYKNLNRGLNIADKADQTAISEVLDDGDVLIIDNLSTASCGLPENDNDAFDQIKRWILDFRNRNITVIIVHHAGRNGQMRGASRREDMAHWILSLKDDSGDGEIKSWITSFSKCRNCQAMEAPPLKWTIQTVDGTLKYTCEPHSGPDAMLALIKDGMETASDLALEMSVTTGCVSKWAKKLATEGKIAIANRKYTAL